MTEHPTLESFIVRIYRVDTEDPWKIAGLVEATDGSGKREPFTDIEELGAILSRGVNAPRKGRKKRPRSGGLDEYDS
jgi:hypothetical protein